MCQQKKKNFSSNFNLILLKNWEIFLFGARQELGSLLGGVDVLTT